jgi:prepilin-type N-terminal cleavage/methylation domain-containing protein
MSYAFHWCGWRRNSGLVSDGQLAGTFNKSARRNQSARAGFTLTELLVVIAVMAILLAQWLPALSRAEGESQSTVCKSNLRQLGMALRLYLDDSVGVYPYTESVPSASPRGRSFWFDALALTMPNAKWGDGVFKCPAYKGVVYEGESKFNNQGGLNAVYAPCGSYAYNAAGRRQPALGPSGFVSAGLGFSISAGRPNGLPVREGDVRVPADLYAFGDAPLATCRWGTVATLRLGGAADYNSLIGENANVQKVQHSRVFNMLLADTHAESVRTEVLLRTNAISRSRWNHDGLP